MPSSTHELGVQAAEHRHLDATAALVADAMDVDSAYRYLFPDERERSQGLRDFFVRHLRLHLEHRCTYVGLSVRDEVVGTVTLRPPGGLQMGTLTMLRHGLVPFALAHGVGAVKRLLWLKRTYDALEAQLSTERPHWYVHMMAVRPGLQGRGIGAALLDRVLAITGAVNSGTDMVLTTHLARNLKFYERAQFQTHMEQTVCPPDALPYPVWGMLRRA